MKRYIARKTPSMKIIGFIVPDLFLMAGDFIAGYSSLKLIKTRCPYAMDVNVQCNIP